MSRTVGDHLWKKGAASPNPNGRPKGFSIVAHLKEMLKNVAPGEKESEATLITQKYIELAKAGDTTILKDLINRVDGLPKGDLGLGEAGGVVFQVQLGSNPKKLKIINHETIN